MSAAWTDHFDMMDIHDIPKPIFFTRFPLSGGGTERHPPHVAQASTTEVAEASTGRGEVEEEDAEMKIGPRASQARKAIRGGLEARVHATR